MEEELVDKYQSFGTAVLGTQTIMRWRAAAVAWVCVSDAASGPGKLFRIEPQLRTNLVHDPGVEVLATAKHREFRHALLAMHRRNRVAVRATGLLVRINPATPLHQPRPKGLALHGISPALSSALSLPKKDIFLSTPRKVIDLNQQC